VAICCSKLGIDEMEACFAGWGGLGSGIARLDLSEAGLYDHHCVGVKVAFYG
jgi:hypothetical protein